MYVPKFGSTNKQNMNILRDQTLVGLELYGKVALIPERDII